MEDQVDEIRTGETKHETTRRIGQGDIRTSALERYNNRCSLCGIDEPSLLIAGHIRGWAKSEKKRGERENVILMCALHDSLFGKGYMCLDYDKSTDSYTVEFAERAVSQEALRQIIRATNLFRKPNSHCPSPEHLGWHKETTYLGWIPTPKTWTLI